jgi:hypothetical protein
MNPDSVCNLCLTRTRTVLISNSTLLETDMIPSEDVSILLMTTRSLIESLAPIVALPPMTKTHSLALPAAAHRKTPILRIVVAETVAHQSRNIANQPGTDLPHHAVAIPLRDTAPHHHEIATRPTNHQSRPRKRLVATEQDTRHSLTHQTLIP